MPTLILASWLVTVGCRDFSTELLGLIRIGEENPWETYLCRLSLNPSRCSLLVSPAEREVCKRRVSDGDEAASAGTKSFPPRSTRGRISSPRNTAGLDAQPLMCLTLKDKMKRGWFFSHLDLCVKHLDTCHFNGLLWSLCQTTLKHYVVLVAATRANEANVVLYDLMRWCSFPNSKNVWLIH